MRDGSDDEKRILPFPVSPVSNGEWCPLPITEKQRLAGKLIAEEIAVQAKRHGMSRAQFLRTAAATLTGFAVVNQLHGFDRTGDAAAMALQREHFEDLAAAQEVLDRNRWFVMDVQQHHVDLETFGDNSAVFCFLDFRPDLRSADVPCPEGIGQLWYVREVFVNSETDIGVISGLPQGVPLAPDGMASTRKLVNRLAGVRRALSQAVCDPKNAPGSPTSIDSLEYQVKKLKTARALKCYTYSGNWRLDDESIAYPMLEEASRVGIEIVNVHKGLPAIFAPGSPESVRTTDFPKVVQDWPNLKFVAYHSGYFQGDTHPEGKAGVSEFLEMVASIPEGLRKNVYAEIGSTFAFTYLNGEAPHVLGQLLKGLGPDNILWGTDSIWWGSPQWLIDNFKVMQIGADLQEQFGYPALTDEVKKKILGLNAARLYGVKPVQRRRFRGKDRLRKLQEQQGGVRAGGSLRWFGPQTRREFLAMLRGEWRPRV